MEIIDISQALREGMAVWPGDEEYSVRWSSQLRTGAFCNISCLTMSVHTGTHLDAPCHFDEGGADIAVVDLSACIGPARVVEITADTCIRAADLAELEWAGVERVLLRTRATGLQEGEWDPRFVYLAEDAANFLGLKKIRLFGTDAPSVDEMDSRHLPVHKVLARHGIAILEGLRLSHVTPGDYELICLPLKLSGLDGSPVRAILRR